MDGQSFSKAHLCRWRGMPANSAGSLQHLHTSKLLCTTSAEASETDDDGIINEFPLINHSISTSFRVEVFFEQTSFFYLIYSNISEFTWLDSDLKIHSGVL